MYVVEGTGVPGIKGAHGDEAARDTNVGHQHPNPEFEHTPKSREQEGVLRILGSCRPRLVSGWRQRHTSSALCVPPTGDLPEARMDFGSDGRKNFFSFLAAVWVWCLWGNMHYCYTARCHGLATQAVWRRDSRNVCLCRWTDRAGREKGRASSQPAARLQEHELVMLSYQWFFLLSFATFAVGGTTTMWSVLMMVAVHSTKG